MTCWPRDLAAGALITSSGKLSPELYKPTRRIDRSNGRLDIETDDLPVSSYPSGHASLCEASLLTLSLPEFRYAVSQTSCHTRRRTSSWMSGFSSKPGAEFRDTAQAARNASPVMSNSRAANSRTDRFQLTHQFRPVQARHAQIAQYGIETARAQLFQCCCAVRCGRHPVAIAAEGFLEHRDHLDFVVDQPGPRRRCRAPRSRPLAQRIFEAHAGNVTITCTAARSILDGIAPPWAIMMLCQTERPRPVPAPTGLVVKNGSRISCAQCRPARPGRCPRPQSHTILARRSVRSHSRRGGGRRLQRLMGVDQRG